MAKKQYGWVLGAFLLLLFSVWWGYTRLLSDRVVMCDVGQGDGMVFIHEFSQLIVDIGPGGGGILHCLGEQLPFWDRHIEVVMITHADSDHLGGLQALLSHFSVGQVITTENALVAVQAVVQQQTHIQTVVAGEQWRWGKVTGVVVWPPQGKIDKDTNHLSLVQRVQFSSDMSLWLPGDADVVVEQALFTSGAIVPSTILKVSHHGSNSASSTLLLDTLKPQEAWISVGAGNRYGHPNDQVLHEITKRGILIRRTDLEGSILFVRHITR